MQLFGLICGFTITCKNLSSRLGAIRLSFTRHMSHFLSKISRSNFGLSQKLLRFVDVDVHKMLHFVLVNGKHFICDFNSCEEILTQLTKPGFTMLIGDNEDVPSTEEKWT